jgi:hypothetical protein
VDALCERVFAHAIVVFDRRTLAEPTARVTVRVAEPGQEADDIIRALIDGAPSPALLTVVTSDKPLYSYARTRGAMILRAHEWNALERMP